MREILDKTVLYQGTLLLDVKNYLKDLNAYKFVVLFINPLKL
jgi:hypothetical protein